MERLYAKRMQAVRPSEIRVLLKLSMNPEIISFGGGNPDARKFPKKELQKVYADVIEQNGAVALNYSITEGIPSLREKLVARMNAQGVNCSFDELFIVQGAQQGLDLIAKAFLDDGDTVITENPTFPGALIVFNPHFANYLPVDMDENGMRMDLLEEALRKNPNAKFIYTISDFQNPTGVTLSLERRKRMVELANEYNVMILEDCPYREMRFVGEHLPPIKSFDTEGRVIYLGTFSKILSPGMRLGWVVANAALTDKLVQLKMAADTQNSTLNMFAADRFMQEYDLDAHIQSVAANYRRKKELMFQTMREEFPAEVRYTDPEGGFFTWLTFPEDINATTLMYDYCLPKAKVSFVPGEAFFPAEKRYNNCRISFSFMDEERIVEGIRRLGGMLRELSAK